MVSRKWLKTTETFAAVESAVQGVEHNPIKDTCSRQRGQFFKFVLASSLQHGAAYMVFVFIPTYLSSDVMRGNADDHFTDPNAFIFNTINSIAYLPMCVAVGYFVDKIGAIPFLSVSALSITVMAPFVFYGFAVSTSSILNWALQFVLVVALCPILGGTSYFWYIDSLLPDPTTRVTVYGVGYNLGAALFGGTATLIGTAMVSSLGPTDGMVWSGVWLSILAILTVVMVGFVEFCEKSSRNKEKVVFQETAPIVIQGNHSNTSVNSGSGSTKGLFTIREASCESTDFDGFDRDSNGTAQFEPLQSASRKLFG